MNRRPALDPAPAPVERHDAAGRACLRASALLSRRARRLGDPGEEQTLLAMAHVLDVLHRGGSASEPVPPAMLSTLTRLVDHLERLEPTIDPVRSPRRPS